MAIAVLPAAILLVRNRRISFVLGRQRRELNHLRDIFAATPGACLIWSSDHASPRSHGLSNIPDYSVPVGGQEFEGLLAYLIEDDRKSLSAAVTAMRRDGVDFSMQGASVGGTILQFNGQAASAASPFQTLWISHLPIADVAKARAPVGHHDDDILDQVGFPVWRRQADLKLSWSNKAYQAIVAASAEAVIDDGIEISDPNILHQARQFALRVIETAKPKSELRFFVVEGARRAFRVTEVPAADGNGLIGFAIDATELVESRMEVERLADGQMEVLNNLTSAVIIFGADRRVAYCNGAFSQLWRVDSAWLDTSPTHAELLERLRETRQLPETADFPAYREQTLRHYSDLLEPLEEMLYRPDGRVLHRIIAARPAGGLVVIDEDVTDTLALERSYNTLIATQRETLDHLFEGIAVFGSDGRLKLFNPAYAKIWNLQASLLDKEPHMVEILDATQQFFDVEGDWETFRKARVDEMSSRDHAAGQQERQDDTILDYNYVALPDGSKLMIYIDVTDTVSMERVLRERNLALEAADRLKSQFLANVSYELRTPLNSIIGFTEILTSEFYGDLNERQAEYGKHISEASGQLLRLIDGVLDLAMIEADRMHISNEELDVHALLAAAFAMARDLTRHRDLQVMFDCPADIGFARGDISRLEQVLLILLNNAIDYTGEGGVITLGAARDSEHLIFWIEDNGAGISQEDQDLVFQKFQRGNAPRQPGGIGLGLALAKSFIELHNGHMELISEVGVGTKVVCYIPGGSCKTATRDARLQSAAS